MNEIVSFTKEIEFDTPIEQITSISIEHTLNNDNESNIKGDLIISGTYKQTELSTIDKPFSYKLPIDIVIDSKYDLSNITIDIDDFTYDVENPNKLKINVDLIIDKLQIKKHKEDEEIVEVDDLFLEKEEDKKLDIPIEKEEKKEIEEDNCVINDSLFSNLASINETYKTYTIYILRENDTLDEVISKYRVTHEQLGEYNDLNNIKTGTKLIIPTSYE